MTPEEINTANDNIQTVVDTVEEYKKQIDKIKKDFVDKINGFIDDLEYIINSGATKSAQFIEMKTKKIMEKIDGALEALRKALNDAIDGITEWFKTQVDKIKESTVKSSLAKVGQSMDEIPEMLLNLIPTPTLSISVPVIPTSNELIGDKISNTSKDEVKEFVKLPRLEI